MMTMMSLNSVSEMAGQANSCLEVSVTVLARIRTHQDDGRTSAGSGLLFCKLIINLHNSSHSLEEFLLGGNFYENIVEMLCYRQLERRMNRFSRKQR